MVEDQPTALRIPDPGLRALLTRDARWQAWLDVEVALAQAEAEIGMIPAASAEEIARKARLELFDIDRVTEGLRVTGHGLVPLIWELDRLCDGDAGGHLHWGATTQNITQTGTVIQVQKAHAIILALIAELLETLAGLAERTKDDALPGRTHGQHAVPSTFGAKVAVWIDELCRHVERLHQAEPRVFVAMLGGGAGTGASFEGHGPRLQERVGELLGLGSMPVPGRTIQDHLVEYVMILAMLDTTCGRAAREIRELMKEEFGEVEEPVPPGSVGSSTMPQKRNPKLCQDIMADETHVRSLVPLAMEAMLSDHEADGSRAVMMGRALAPAIEMTGDILVRMNELFAGLRVFPERMRQNLDLSGGLIMSESLMLTLGRELGRQRAHDAVYEAAQEAAVSGESFAALLAARPEVQGHLDAERIDALLDPVAYTGDSARQATEQATRARDLAARIANGG
ncbi:MAG: adenylosuccinate lyase family protein [Chloroflexi bacterium]|nr:adenylosuccinate lyase family protein [Chloroflexota bacterium]MDA1147246.1 adenylosuccinate lyase family protein [Chloroflexota bacterium]